MLEVYNAWLASPLMIQLICLAPVLLIPLLWLCSPKRSHPWSYNWERHIDSELAMVRKKFKGKLRRIAYEDTFSRLIVQLEKETGRPNFVLMSNPEHRCVWMYLFRKIHYTL